MKAIFYRKGKNQYDLACDIFFYMCVFIFKLLFRMMMIKLMLKITVNENTKKRINTSRWKHIIN